MAGKQQFQVDPAALSDYASQMATLAQENRRQSPGAGPEQLGAEIVRLAAEANRAALTEGLGALSLVLGDAGTVDMARSIGLGALIDPDAPVLPYTPRTDPNADRWQVIESPVATTTADDDDYALTFDFSSLRSDR